LGDAGAWSAREAVTVSKRWSRVADRYGVEIASGQNPVVILAATVALDAMAHPAR
jgi:uncharacterized protein YxjI